jgi:hypothetical protein
MPGVLVFFLNYQANDNRAANVSIVRRKPDIFLLMVLRAKRKDGWWLLGVVPIRLLEAIVSVKAPKNY